MAVVQFEDYYSVGLSQTKDYEKEANYTFYLFYTVDYNLTYDWVNVSGQYEFNLIVL